MQTGLTPKPAATSYGEGFVFRVYEAVVQLHVVACLGCDLNEMVVEEEVVVIHHAITGPIQSHRIIFRCVCAAAVAARVSEGLPPRRSYLVLRASGFRFRQIRRLPSLCRYKTSYNRRYALYHLRCPAPAFHHLGEARACIDSIRSVSKFRTHLVPSDGTFCVAFSYIPISIQIVVLEHAGGIRVENN